MKNVTLLLFTFALLTAPCLGDEKREEKKPVPISRTIKIAEEPRTIDPIEILPKQLTQKVTVQFEHWTLREFATWLEKTTKLPVLLNKIALGDEGISELEPVSGDCENESLYLLINRVINSSPVQLAYYIEGEVLYLTTAVEAEGIEFSKIYDVTTLIESGYALEDIVHVIQQFTVGSWEEIHGAGGIIQPLGNVMLVRCTQNTHDEINGIFKALQKPARQTFVLLPEQHLDYLAKMDQKVSVNFINTPLINVVESLAKQTDLPIRIDPSSLEEEGISLRQPVHLKLTDVSLKTVLQALVLSKPIAWMPKDGALYITTEAAAEIFTHTAFYDVRDLCRNEEEAEALSEAHMTQTSGPWENVDGAGGTIYFPKPGLMVVHHQLKVHQEIANLLAIYRKVLLSAKPQEIPKEEDLSKIITHYYKMDAAMAKSLYETIPLLVEPDSWVQASGKGEIYHLHSESKIIYQTIEHSKNANSKKSGSSKQLVTQIPQAVLLIKQTKAVHKKINQVIRRATSGDGDFEYKSGLQNGGQLGGGQGRGGFGSGFFSLPADKK